MIYFFTENGNPRKEDKMKKICTGFLAAILVFSAAYAADDRTWVEIKKEVYGAKPDNTGPIGGGEGYKYIVTTGNYIVDNLDSLLSALEKAKAGDVIFIPGETEIDLTAMVYIEQLTLKIPGGVTLAGERGNKGSKGAILTSDALRTRPLIQIEGPDVRITGLRIKGPNPKRYLEHHSRAFRKGGLGSKYYYLFPTSDGIINRHGSLEVDNCEITAFSHAGISLSRGDKNHIHHCCIHHCQYNGLGYGISHGTATSLIEFNIFDSNRHSIAGTGAPGCGYIARNNIELGVSLSHCFDMHGGRDRDDGTTVAGTTIEIYNNTFRAPQRAINIRGVPENKCDVHHNWLLKHAEGNDQAVRHAEKTNVFNNAYGEKPKAAK
jgi:hypothetical protein